MSSTGTVDSPLAVAPEPVAHRRTRSTQLLAALTHRSAIIAGVVTLIAAIVAIGPWPVGVFYDDGIYLILGKSLATGQGLRYLNLPGHPAATHYPPGYPALLALLWKLAPSFPANVALFKLANAVLLAVACGGLTRFATNRLRLAPWVSAATVVAFSITIPVLTVAGVLFSEPLFLALLGPTLIVSEKAIDESESPSRLIAAGILCGLLTLVRTVGIAAVAGVILTLAIRRRGGAALTFGAVAATVLLPWQLWVTAHTGEVPAILEGSYGSYLGWFIDAFRDHGASFALAVASHNAVEIARPVGTLFSALRATPLPWLVTAVMFATFFLGLWRSMKLAPVFASFVAGYLVIVLLWPYVPDRFLWGVWPLLGLVTVVGVMAVVQWRSAQPVARVARIAALVARIAALVILTFAGASYLRYNVRGYAGRWWDSAQRGSAIGQLPLARWTLANTAITDVVATDGDPLIYLYTGRQTVPVISWTAAEYLRAQSDAQSRANLRTTIDLFHVRYVMLPGSSALGANAARTLAGEKPASLKLIQQLPEGGAVFSTSQK